MDIVTPRVKGEDRRCTTVRCLGTPKKNRLECDKCRQRKCRVKNELRTTYIQKRRNAWKDSIEFSLTIEEWEDFCNETNYLNLRGPNGDDMTVGRINHFKGYSRDNIKIQTRIDNSKEGKSGQRPKYVKQPGDPF